MSWTDFLIDLPFCAAYQVSTQAHADNDVIVINNGDSVPRLAQNEHRSYNKFGVCAQLTKNIIDKNTIIS